MSSSLVFSRELPPPPAAVFLVGIGGIGMSGLAQLLVWQGYRVSGSDRGLDDPDKSELYGQLRRQGIALYAQDGSGPVAEKPDLCILSAAIEADNADLLAAGTVPLLHRATALAQAVGRSGAKVLAVAGSCGKTSVTGWLASALRSLGKRILMVNGGYTLDFADGRRPGNFHADAEPEYAVIEVDESDRSIREFTPDYAVLLNVGNDHYGQDELLQVFGDFLRRARCGVVLPETLRQLAAGLPAVRCFTPFPAAGTATAAGASFAYQVFPWGMSVCLPGFGLVRCRQTGHYSVENAAAVLQLLALLPLGVAPADLAASLQTFSGVRQRFELLSAPGAVPAVLNDYAHNPEKIAAVMAAARERFGSPLLVYFQPHGYGPLGFMREALGKALRQALQPGDIFCFLPVFYAGGSSSFTPTSAAVAADLQAAGVPVTVAADRTAAAALPRSAMAAVLVLGARDPSLHSWTAALAAGGAD